MNLSQLEDKIDKELNLICSNGIVFNKIRANKLFKLKEKIRDYRQIKLILDEFKAFE